MQFSRDNRFYQGSFAAPDQILVATDLSDSAYLIPHVIAQAKTSNAHVTLVHAILPAISISVEAGAIPSVDQLPLDRDLRSTLLGMARQIEAHGISCDIVSERGYAPDVIREEIKDTGATRLIMGTRGRGKLGELAFGSVACELLRTVDIPIFAVGPYAENRTDHSLPRKILHPVSFVGAYQKTVDFSIQLARTYESELSLLHVLHPSPRNGDDRVRWTKCALAALAGRGIDLVSPGQTIVTFGNVVDEILKAAIRTNADWIVMGVDQSFSFWSLKDSRAYSVLAYAHCAVLTMRHDQHRLKQKRPGLASAATAVA